MKDTRIMRTLMNILVLSALLVCQVPAHALSFGNQEQPQAQFHSTSTLQGSGSAYSSTPALEADGTASAPSGAAGGPRKIGGLPGSGGGEAMPDNSKVGDNTPIGDAVLPLMLMAAAAAGVIALRRRRVAVKE